MATHTGYSCDCAEGFSGQQCSTGEDLGSFDICDSPSAIPAGVAGLLFDGTPGPGYEQDRNCGPVTISAPSAEQQVFLHFIDFDLESK